MIVEMRAKAQTLLNLVELYSHRSLTKAGVPLVRTSLRSGYSLYSSLLHTCSSAAGCRFYPSCEFISINSLCLSL